MKYRLLIIVSLFAIVTTQAQRFLITEEHLESYFKNNPTYPVKRVLIDMDAQATSFYLDWCKTGFKDIFLDDLEKTDTDSLETIYDELPTIYPVSYLDMIYNKSKKQFGYYMLHSSSSSTIDLDYLLVFPIGMLSKYEDFKLEFVSAYYNGEVITENRTDNYMDPDSVKAFAYYHIPNKVDTIRINLDSIPEKNAYNMNIRRYKDYGVIVDLPYVRDQRIYDVRGISYNNKVLKSEIVYDHYINRALDEYELKGVKRDERILKKVLRLRGLDDVLDIEVLKDTIAYMNSGNYVIPSATEDFIDSTTYLIKTFGPAKELVLYIANQEKYVTENFVFYKQQATHPDIEIYSDYALGYNKSTYLRNKKTKKGVIDIVHEGMRHLGSNYFEAFGLVGNGYIRYVVNEKGEVLKHPNQFYSSRLLPSGGILFEDIFKEKDTGEMCFEIYDKYGYLKWSFIDDSTMIKYDIIESSHYIKIENSNGIRFILKNYDLTEYYNDYLLLNDSNLVVFKDDKWAIINDLGTYVVPFQDSQCIAINGNYLLISEANKQWVVNSKNEMVYTEEKHNLQPLETNFKFKIPYPKLDLLTFKENGLFGVKTIKGEIIFPAQAVEITQISDVHIRMKREDSKVGVIDYLGEIVEPFN